MEMSDWSSDVCSSDLANPASSRLRFKYLRVHRTDVLDHPAGRNRHDSWGALFERSQIVDRISPKLGEAARGTKIIGLPLVLIRTGCRSRLHRHTTDSIDRRSARRNWSWLHHRKGFSCSWFGRAYQLRLQRSLRIDFKPFQTRQPAEVVTQASMIVIAGRRSRIDRHSADWIDRHLSSKKC